MLLLTLTFVFIPFVNVERMFRLLGHDNSRMKGEDADIRAFLDIRSQPLLPIYPEMPLKHTKVDRLGQAYASTLGSTIARLGWNDR